MDRMDNKDHEVTPGRPVPQARRGPVVCLVSQVTTGPLVHRAIPDLKDQQEPRAILDHQDQLDPQDQLDSPVHQVVLVLLVPVEPMVKQGPRDPRGPWVYRER